MYAINVRHPFAILHLGKYPCLVSRHPLAAIVGVGHAIPRGAAGGGLEVTIRNSVVTNSSILLQRVTARDNVAVGISKRRHPLSLE